MCVYTFTVIYVYMYFIICIYLIFLHFCLHKYACFFRAWYIHTHNICVYTFTVIYVFHYTHVYIFHFSSSWRECEWKKIMFLNEENNELIEIMILPKLDNICSYNWRNFWAGFYRAHKMDYGVSIIWGRFQIDTVKWYWRQIIVWWTYNQDVEHFSSTSWNKMMVHLVPA